MKNTNKKLPHDFNPAIYYELNPDVAKSGLSAEAHYLDFGVYEGRMYAITDVEFDDSAQFQKSRDTVLVVGHEASASGAPILCLNISRSLAEKYNVVIILLDGGEIESSFALPGVHTIISRESKNNSEVAANLIQKLCSRYQFKFAILNTVASEPLLKPLARNYIPTIGLIHEFASYMNRHGAFRSFLLWNTKVIFSNELTYEDALSHYPDFSRRSVEIIPQGKCDLEQISFRNLPRMHSNAFNELSSNSKKILGVGTIEYRKGVDLFISVAKLFYSRNSADIQFEWIGSTQSNSENERYLLYLQDQIKRSGLVNNVVISPHTPNIQDAYSTARLLLLPSRLDPLPNVAIDCLCLGVPVLCFDRTTGIAKYLAEGGLQDSCVAEYLDLNDMVEKLEVLIASNKDYEIASRSSKDIGEKYFDFTKYIEKIDAVCNEAALDLNRQLEEVEVILQSNVFRSDFAPHPIESAYDHDNLSNPEDERYQVFSYVRSWSVGSIGLRKPFPGFNPAEYAEKNIISRKDPLADFLRKKSPAGPWLNRCINLAKESPDHNLSDSEVAIHVHVYYFDIFEQTILPLLLKNKLRPDLFLSTHSADIANKLKALLCSYSGKYKILVVSNLGRDIRPFLHEFGYAEFSGYKFLGHFHTKKSTHVAKNIGDAWTSFVMESLIASKSGLATADRILKHLVDNPLVGLVYPDDPNIVGWTQNKAIAQNLLSSLGIEELRDNFDFPIGTMFWANPKAIKSLFDLVIDYPAEPIPIDGTVLHAIERLFPFVVEKAGFQVTTVNLPGLSR